VIRVNGIYQERPCGAVLLLHRYAPGDMWAEVKGLGIAVRASDGRTVLVGSGNTNPHPCELAGIPDLHWYAACV
jgi:hypothetical protein